MKESYYNYDPIAYKYDQWYQTSMGRLMDQQEKKSVYSVLPSPQSHPKVLEVGCGTGHWTQWLSALGYHILAIDISKNMLEIAVKKNIRNAYFMQRSAFDLPIEGKKFDCAISITALEFIPDKSQILKNMVQSVRKNGVIIIGTLNKHSILTLKRIIQERLGNKNKYSVANYYTYDSLYQDLQPFGQTQVIGSTYVLPFSSLIPISKGFEVIGENMFPKWGNFLVGKVIVQ